MTAHPRIGNTLPVQTDRVYVAKPSPAKIMRVFGQATPAELMRGMTWYDTAHNLAVTLDPANPRQAAGVIAVVSPMMDWARNMEVAINAYQTGEMTGCLYSNAMKANRIMAGEPADEVIGGRKVTAFFGVIADPTSDAVVIDRHAFDIAVGRVTNDKSRGALSRKGVYDAFAAAYSTAARKLSVELGMPVSASQVQAVSWVVWRRLKGFPD